MDQSDNYFDINGGFAKFRNIANNEETYRNSEFIYDFSRNYDKSWDFVQVRQNSEDNKPRDKNLENPQIFFDGLVTDHSIEVSDLRSQGDYDKPWDLRPHKKDERGQEGYDRPWDLKPHNMDERPTEEYDVPWDKSALRIERELQAKNLEFIKKKEESKRVASLASTQMSKGLSDMAKSVNFSKMPVVSKAFKSVDTRCNEEYDEPWDQRLRNITQAAMLRSQNHSANPKRNSSHFKRSKTCLFDLKAPLEKQSWYHGIISRTQAESILRSCCEGSYLVRISESNHKDYSLSLKSMRGFMHMRITKQEAGYVLGQFSQPFQNIPQMINHYTINKLPIKGAEHICLVHPVPHECL